MVWQIRKYTLDKSCRVHHRAHREIYKECHTDTKKKRSNIQWFACAYDGIVIEGRWGSKCKWVGNSGIRATGEGGEDCWFDVCHGWLLLAVRVKEVKKSNGGVALLVECLQVELLRAYFTVPLHGYFWYPRKIHQITYNSNASLMKKIEENEATQQHGS